MNPSTRQNEEFTPLYCSGMSPEAEQVWIMRQWNKYAISSRKGPAEIAITEPVPDSEVA